MESSYEWQIKLIRDWQYFATLTWNPHDLGTMWKRRNQVTYWLRKVAQMGETTEKTLTYIIRWESGETGGLPHCHILISGMMRTTNPLTTAFRMKNTWIRGVAQVRLFDAGKALGNAAYMTKGKFSAYWAQGANAYEVRKFGQVSDDSIYVSRRAQERMLEQRLGADDRAHSTQAA
jgi:hypothetical protein